MVTLTEYNTFANLVAETTMAEANLERNHREYKKNEEKKDERPPQLRKSSGTLTTRGGSTDNPDSCPMTVSALCAAKRGIGRRIIQAIYIQ
ncbi:hypothetical protein PanWU01x14_342550 [Parasponia andersonii]|uniref:Uncharacterized protein n=1 Tax=Parasponia andersonii TaxID=3476 RepID=A0A2P5ADP3_PARAD|nr:hypothetical protein PanWU01x14_342550 [Parasponia andersonii]